MNRYLIALFALLLSCYLVAQDDHDFEVGVEHFTKKVLLLTGDKGASMFLDGQLVGHEKAKVKLDSQEPNLLITTYKNGSLTVEQLDVSFTPEEYTIKPVTRLKTIKQNQAYFDSLFIVNKYAILEDKFIGWNEKEELYWRAPFKTAFTSNDRLFTNSQTDYLNLYGLPCGNFGFDTSIYRYQLIFSIDEVFVNVQDDFGYIHIKFSVSVLNREGQEIYHKQLFGVNAQATPVYSFKQGVNDAFQMGLTQLINNTTFINSVKRKNKRDHKKRKPVIVATIKKDTLTTEGDVVILEKGFPTKYMNAVARLKTDKGLFVGFVIAEAGYLLTNKNFVGNANEIYIKVKGQRTVKGKVLRKGTKTGVVLVQILANKKFLSLELADENPQKGDTIYSVMPGKKWGYKKGSYQDEVAVFGNFYHTAKLIPGKSTDGSPVLNEKGEVIGLLDSKIAGNSKQKLEFIIPIKDALDDLNLKLE